MVLLRGFHTASSRKNAPEVDLLEKRKNGREKCDFILDKEQFSEQLRTQLDNRLEELVAIMESDKCMPRQILRALGESDTQNCGRCSNCQRNRRSSHED